MCVLQYYVNFQSSHTVTDCDSLIRGDQRPPNFCLHRVARMLRPALQRFQPTSIALKRVYD